MCEVAAMNGIELCVCESSGSLRVEAGGLVDLLLNEAAGILVVFAHPDDEAIGIGGLLPFLHNVWFACVTDGSPRRLDDALRAGFADRNAYAAHREKELRAAITHAGHDASRLVPMAYADQEASFELAEISRALAELFTKISPGVVVTHAYEGGHPDHDAAAFAVHAACGLLSQRGTLPPLLVEMGSYHAKSDGIEWGHFLPGVPSVSTVLLNDEMRTRKKGLLACYGSQVPVLAQVPVAEERVRLAPRYDFTVPPHDGKLFYENFNWGITGNEWRKRAAAALYELELTNKPA
ncbi:MAG: PIG-L family deacetylase [Nibricoccus sp.]